MDDSQASNLSEPDSVHEPPDADMALPPAAPPPPQAHSDEDIYKAMKGIFESIPDTSTTTVKQLREKTAEALGLGTDGLEDRKALTKKLMSALVNDSSLIFVEGALPNSVAANTASDVWRSALAKVDGFILRKLPKPDFRPLVASIIDINTLMLLDFHGRNPVKSMVDIVLDHTSPIDADQIKTLVVDGELDQLPLILKSPDGAPDIKHFTQTAIIPTPGAAWNIVRFITFQSDSPDGKVKGSLATHFAHGTPYLVNFGHPPKNGKKVFQQLFQDQVG